MIIRSIAMLAGFAVAWSMVCSASALAQDLAPATPTEPTHIDAAMFFQSVPRDAAVCDLAVAEDGSLRVPDAVTNPASSCPDASSWKAFLSAIQSKFWMKWSIDEHTWPAKPLALCGTQGADPKACCDPNSLNNPGHDNANPGIYCPFYRGDHPDFKVTLLSAPGAFRQGHGTFINLTDPGRVLRQENAEIVYRNRPLFEYFFANDLYSQDGLARAFSRAQDTAQKAAPYHRIGATIDVPIGSVALKTDWVHKDAMLKMGLISETDPSGRPLDPPQNVDAPYITMNLTSDVPDDDPERFKPGLHYLVGMTVSTKDLPQWLWFAFEHVNNPGRCDFTGCNDSFGYRSAGSEKGTYRNFVEPHQIPDNLDKGFTVFDTGKAYTSGKVSPSLAAIYDRLGMVDAVDDDPGMPSATDRAWRSYRLKGSQTQFVTTEGYRTLLGNSVTEGGFVNSSSCMTCHAQASVAADGTPAIPNRGFAVELNMLGYPRSTLGAPELGWFFVPGSNAYRALQADFTWGIIYAHPELKPDEIPADLK